MKKYKLKFLISKKQELVMMKVGEIKVFWHDDFEGEWFWVERLNNKKWLVEKHWDNGKNDKTLQYKKIKKIK